MYIHVMCKVLKLVELEMSENSEENRNEMGSKNKKLNKLKKGQNAILHEGYELSSQAKGKLFQ